jgi:hypothetical protein
MITLHSVSRIIGSAAGVAISTLYNYDLSRTSDYGAQRQRLNLLK